MRGSSGRHVVGLLGVVTVRFADGSLVTGLRAKEQALLAYALLEEGPRSRESLCGLLWPSQDASAARNNLRVALSRLRRALGDPPWLAVDRDTVTADAAGVDVDVHRLLGGDVEAARCGTLLEGIALRGCADFEAWLLAWRERLRVVVVDLLGREARTALRRGDTVAAAALAARLVEADPLLGAGYELRARALVELGDRRGAAELLAAHAERLEAELGVAPSESTTRLLAELRDPVGSDRDGPPPDPGGETRRGPVSAEHELRRPFTPVTTFHGRATELRELDTLLRTRTARIVTLTGPGGIGKTRLAVEVAHRCGRYYGDGAVFVRLTEVTDATVAVDQLADALGLRDVPDAPDPAAALLAQLEKLDVLLVVDNVDHEAIDVVAPLLARVAASCRYVVVLATGREPLRVTAELEQRLDGLGQPDADAPDLAEHAAVQLFLDRARRVGSELRLDGGDRAVAAAVADVCRLVEGQPLGIELAAAALRDAPLPVVLERLRRRPHELRSTLRDVDASHASLAAVFEGALDALPPDARDAAARLSVFRGGCTSHAAEVVADAGPAVVARLVRASLLVQTPAGRLRMHELVRQFAARLLDRDARERRAAERRHEDHVLGELAAAAPAFDRVGAGRVRDRMVAELANIRRAWQTACSAGRHDLLVDASAGLVGLGASSGHRRELGELLLAGADAAAGSGDAAAEATLLERALRAMWPLLDPERVRALRDRALALAEDLPDGEQVAAAVHLTWAEVADQRLADKGATDDALAAARDLAPAVDDPVFDAFVDAAEGAVVRRRAEFDRGEELLASAAARLRDEGHLRGVATAQAWLSPGYAEQYDVWNALTSDRAALAAFEQLGNDARRAVLERNVGASYALLGAWERALRHTESALAMAREQQDGPSAAHALVQRAEVLAGLGRWDDATRDFEEGIGQLRAHDEREVLRVRQVPWVWHLLRLERAVQAEVVARDVVSANRAVGSTPHESTGLAALARALVAQGRREDAVPLAEEVWCRHGDTNDGAGLPRPIETFLDLHAVFRAVSDPRADEVWHLAGAVMRRTAASIPSPRLRASYLERVAGCRVLTGLDGDPPHGR